MLSFQPDYRYINYIFKHRDQKNYYTSNLNKMYHFAASILFYDIAQLRFPPKAIWVQQVVSLVFPGTWLRKIFLVCSIGMYVDGICVINVFIYSWIHSPIFTSFAQQIRRPLCVHHDLLLAARICLHLSQRLACIIGDPLLLFDFFEDKNES